MAISTCIVVAVSVQTPQILWDEITLPRIRLESKLKPGLYLFGLQAKYPKNFAIYLNIQNQRDWHVNPLRPPFQCRRLRPTLIVK